MQKSESIIELAKALSKAQGDITGAEKDARGNYSTYATLDSVWKACRAALTANGLSVAQFPSSDGVKVSVETTLMHASGEWLTGECAATAKDATPQSIGSCTTYLRRYGLAAIVGVAPSDDDDGEAAQPARNGHTTKQNANAVQAKTNVEPIARAAFPNIPRPSPTDELRAKIRAAHKIQKWTKDEIEADVIATLKKAGVNRESVASLDELSHDELVLIREDMERAGMVK